MENHIFINSLLLSLLIISMGLISLMMYRKQMLISLLSLEICTLGSFLALCSIFSMLGEFISISFFMLVFGACEACLGLVILVNMTRLDGSDMVVLITNIKC